MAGLALISGLTCNAVLGVAPAAGITAEQLTVRLMPSEIAAGKVSEATASAAATLLERHGCVLLRQVAGGSLNEMLTENVNANYDACRSALAAKGIGPADPFAFAEIVCRSHLRFDMQLGELASQPLDPSRLSKAPWSPILERVLGPQQRLLFAGAVIAEPSARSQGQHMDGGHLFHDTHGWDQPQCPAHCVNIFLPLVDIGDDDSLGPTEFWPGSHRVTEARAAYGDEAGLPLAGNRGDAILFDYRVIHRGMANGGSSKRPVVYATYARPWFSDVVNFPEERLFAPKKGGGASGGFGAKAGGGAKPKKAKAKKR